MDLPWTVISSIPSVHGPCLGDSIIKHFFHTWLSVSTSRILHQEHCIYSFKSEEENLFLMQRYAHQNKSSTGEKITVDSQYSQIQEYLCQRRMYHSSRLYRRSLRKQPNAGPRRSLHVVVLALVDLHGRRQFPIP
jgi:hypothetical protein